MAASNESQGLKIAVAVFVTLTVILAVTSYFLYSSYARSEGLLASETDKASKSRREADEALTQYDEFRKTIGARATEFDPAKTEIATHLKKVEDRLLGIANMVNASVSRAQAAGAQGPELEDAKQKVQLAIESFKKEPNKNYISALDRLVELLENLSLVDAELSAHETSLRSNLESATSVAKQQIDVQAKSAEDTRTDLEAEHNKHEQERQVLLTKVDQLTTDLDQARTDIANLTTQLRQTKEEDDRKVEQLTAILREQRDVIDRRENVLDRPDGRITYVDLGTNEVHVNVTRAQGARPQMNMTIFDQGSPGIPTEKPKGNIMLTQVGDTYSIAKIVKTNSPIEPMRVNDIVYSPTWSPNEPMMFALLGKLDVNRDGRDDRDDLKRMIEAAGGSIAYDLPPPDVGKESGKLDARISWYVTDDVKERPPLRDTYVAKTDASIAQQALFDQRFGEMVKEARTNGIRPISLGRLLAYLGYDMNTPVAGRSEAVNERALQQLTAPRPRTDAQKAEDSAAPAPESDEMQDQP
ncbi:hypothetical protein [Planctomyces sp. SH-PL62]|uniref:hypothetical protein n=1 Tax=Planctomyces sp. SH-PL62 TaxID=1636152 RepID=UPI00078C32C9|nr:hypothetical protein [Planctomyces sp. SH-PL62]AMV39314.1 hypothetical protein VT85_17895 [Planctomyces sp. SH-PL62]